VLQIERLGKVAIGVIPRSAELDQYMIGRSRCGHRLRIDRLSPRKHLNPGRSNSTPTQRCTRTGHARPPHICVILVAGSGTLVEMFEHFTDGARRILVLAQMEAQNFHDRSIRPNTSSWA
jgi:hypothetical protein